MNSGFFKVPNDIFDHGLSSKAIVVYCCLRRHAGARSECFPSRGKVASECGIGVSTVDRAIAELITRDLIRKDTRKNAIGGRTSNIYHLPDP